MNASAIAKLYLILVVHILHVKDLLPITHIVRGNVLFSVVSVCLFARVRLPLSHDTLRQALDPLLLVGRKLPPLGRRNGDGAVVTMLWDVMEGC